MKAFLFIINIFLAVVFAVIYITTICPILIPYLDLTYLMFLCLFSLLIMSIIEALVICFNADEDHWSFIVVNLLLCIALIIFIIKAVELKQVITELRNGKGIFDGLILAVALLFSPIIISTIASSILLLFISVINRKDNWKSIILSVVGIVANVIFLFLKDVIFNINTVWIYILIAMTISILSLVNTARDG